MKQPFGAARQRRHGGLFRPAAAVGGMGGCVTQESKEPGSGSEDLRTGFLFRFRDAGLRITAQERRHGGRRSRSRNERMTERSEGMSE